MCCRRTPRARKKRALRRRAHGLPARTALLAEDETDLRLFPPLRAGWAKRGEPAPVPISGANAKRVVFGAMNLRTGTRLFRACRHGRGADFRSFLGLVRERYRGRGVALLLDEDSCHTAGESRRAAERLGVELLWLPTRSPHLNPMDHLWRHAKQAVCANRQYESIEEEVRRFVRYLEDLTAGQALNKAGAFADDFWLDL
jgi:transposase